MMLHANVEFVILQEGGRRPEKKHKLDAGYDLYISRDVTIQAGQFADVHTDVAVIFPEGLWGRITGRSSTFRTRGLLVIEGIIDGGYTGELFTGVYNTTQNPVHLKKGDRIAQLVPHKLVDIKWVQAESEDLQELDGRGSSGFGSTG